MAERWVSVGRKHCEICKVWFADNKASIEFHERGEGHKKALQQKLRDVGRQRELKEHAEINLKGQLAAMQAGAFLQMKKYGEEADDGTTAITGVQSSKYFDPRAAGTNISEMAAEMAKLTDQRKNGQYRRPDGPSGPVPVKVDREALARAQKHAAREAENKAKKQAKIYMEADKQKAELQAERERIKQIKQWVQAETEEGKTYYWHMYSGETAWEPPGTFYTPIEYEVYLASLDAEKEIVHNFELAEAGEREGDYNPEAQAAYEQFYGGEQLPESSEYLLEIKQKRQQGVKRPRDRRPKAQPDPLPGTIYAPGAIGFIKPAISSRLNDVEDINSIPLPQFEPGMAPEVKQEEPEEEPQVYNYVTSEPVEEKVVDSNTGIGGWTKVVKKEETQEKFFSPLTARYRELEEQEKREAVEAAAVTAIKEEKEEKIEFTEKVATVKVKGPVEFKKRTGGAARNVRKREE